MYNYAEICNLTSGNPLLLEIINYHKERKKYIYEEIFSHLTEEERKIIEILSTSITPLPYDAFFIDNKILPETIDSLVQKLIIKEPSDGFYDTHEFIKDFFYRRMNPKTRYQYHKSLGEWYINQKLSMDYLEALYHYIKSLEYQKAIDLAKENAQNIIDKGLSEKFIYVLGELPEEQISLPELSEILMLKARLCFIIGDWDKSLQYYYRTVEVSTELRKEDMTAKAHCEIGHILEEQNSFDDALINFQKSLKISKKLKDAKRIAEAKRGIGRVHWRKADYKNAEKYYKEGLKAINRLRDSKLIGSINIDLGIISSENNKFDQAIKYFKMALSHLQQIDNKLEIARAYNNLGTAYICVFKFKAGIECFKKQLQIGEEIGGIRPIGYSLSNLAYCYVKLNRISKAEVYIARAERSIEKTRDENLQFVISITNGLIQKYYRNWDEAINHFEKSIKIIEKFNIPIHYSQALLDFGLLYESKGDFVNSKKYYQKAYVVCQTAGLTVPKSLKTKL